MGSGEAVRERNKSTKQQPSPLLFNGIENRHDYNNTMERAAILARRDIRLGNLPQYSDLDFIPVKEPKTSNLVRNEVQTPQKRHSSSMVHASFSPGRCFTSRDKGKNSVSSRVALSWKPKDPKQYVVNIPTEEESNSKNGPKYSISNMIDNLQHASHDLGKCTIKKNYPDVIEEDRLQRRVEEQRRHVYRMLYNLRRHVTQLVNQLERTPFNHRDSVLRQSSIMCHMSTAYRSLISVLNSFIRVSHTLHSTFMTELKKKVKSEVKSLLEEFGAVCNLLDMQIISLDSPSSSPITSSANQSGQVPKLNITSSNLKGKSVAAPLSPERNESLKAAVKSLITAPASNQKNRPSQNMAPRSKQKNPRQTLSMDKKVTDKRPASGKKIIKPKSGVSRYPIKYKRVASAKSSTNGRPFGKVTEPLQRPSSAPASGDPLEIRGCVTPFITEREMARQAWIDELGKGQANLEHGVMTPDRAPSPVRMFTLGEPISLAQKFVTNAPVSGKETTNFKTNELSMTMVQLLDKLEDIEKEDEEIRSRWLHIQCSDPYKKSQASPIILPCANLLQHQPSSSSLVPPVLSQCRDIGPARLALPDRTLREVSSYRDDVLQYLRLTKHFRTKGFNPWATINGIVDDIVDGLVGDLCKEITTSCDGLADNIYLSEFLPA